MFVTNHPGYTFSFSVGVFCFAADYSPFTLGTVVSVEATMATNYQLGLFKLQGETLNILYLVWAVSRHLLLSPRISIH